MGGPGPLDAYRPNAGIVLFNAEGRVWIGRRADTRGVEAWQFPQGGLDPGEDPRAAALRELAEEAGIDPGDVEPLGEIPGWLTYDYPPEMRRKGKWKGQKQRWFAFRYRGADSGIALDRHGEVEFDAWRWERLEAVPPLIISWKRPVYDAVAKAFARYALKTG